MIKSSESRRDLILATVQDLVIDFVEYDRREDEELGDYEESLLWWLTRHLGDVEGRECYEESRTQRKAMEVI